MMFVGTVLVNQLLCVQVYKAKRPGVPVRVYFLFYENSVEEQVLYTCTVYS